MKKIEILAEYAWAGMQVMIGIMVIAFVGWVVGAVLTVIFL